MRLGAIIGAIADPANPRAIGEQSKMYVGEGFESLWVPQAIGRGFFLPDPLMMLTVAATVTEEVPLGTAILQVTLYHPMDLAHRIFSLQQICGDRLIIGVGAGSTEKDFLTLDRDYAGRFGAYRETIAELREALKTGKRGATDLSPWPHVQGGPPFFFGTWGNGVEKAAKEYDGWIASGAYKPVDEVVETAKTFRAAGGTRSLVSTINVSRETDLGKLKEDLSRYAGAGFDDAVVIILPGGPTPAEVRKLVD